MKIHCEKHRLNVTGSDLSGSLFDDVNLSGCLNMAGWRVLNVNLSGLRIDGANLAGASIVNSRLQGMTIDGIEVSDLLALWKERETSPKAATL